MKRLRVARATAPWLIAVLAAAGIGLAAGCTSDGIDPPRDEDLIVEDSVVTVDSLAAWAVRARDGWASGDSARVREAGVFAQAAFAGAWSDRLDAASTDALGRNAERLPRRVADGLPTPEAIRDVLTGLGLSTEIVVAEGPFALWQVVVRDPTGGADAGTEFWAWPDPAAAMSEPVMQALPSTAPRRARFGPEGIGALATYTRPGGVGLASAWTRPQGSGGVEVALVERTTAGGRTEPWRVASTRQLPIAADSVSFLPGAPGEPAPGLVIRGPGPRDPLFDTCPTCPHVDKRQRYAYLGATWVLREEQSEPSPYAVIVAFMHGLRDGGPEGALPWASGPEVLDQVRELGLERGPHAPLRAAPGTALFDVTQRYRRGGADGSDALEITVERQGDRWVVADLRSTRIVIE